MKRGVGIALLLFLGILLGGMAVSLLYDGTATAAPSGKIIFVSVDFVDDPENHKWDTLEEGVNDAQPGDTIAVFSGTYGPVDVYKDNITISGESSGSVTIMGDAHDYAVKVTEDNVTIQNVTLHGQSLPALYADTGYDFLTVRHCTMQQDSRKSGTCAAYIGGNNASIFNCTFRNAGWGLNVIRAHHCVLRDTSFTNIENKAVVLNTSSDIFVENITASDVFCGLRLVETTASRVVNSTFADSKVGLVIDHGARGNDVRYCRFESNAGISTDFGYGIYLNASRNNSVTSCTIEGNDRGVYAEATTADNLIHHNNFIDNGINAIDHGNNSWNSSIGNYWDDYTGGDADHDGIGDIPYLTSNNSRDYRPLVAPVQTPPAHVWVDDDFTSEETPGWQLDHFDTLQAALDTVTAGGGCYVYNGSYQPCTVAKNVSFIGAGDANVSGGSEGILVTADGVSVKGFDVSASNVAIKIQNARWVRVADCEATKAVIGVYLVNANECQLHRLSVHDNEKGIFLFDTVASTIRGSNVSTNAYFGVELSHVSRNNTVASCHVADNGNYGAYIVQNSTGNRFVHNNFVGNTAYDACGNQWGGTYREALGNYWSEFDTPEEGAMDTNRDGMADSPYTIEGGSQDNYPLMHPICNPPHFVWVNKDFDSSNPGWDIDHFSSIQTAVDTARTDGGCFVYDGTYQENVMLDTTISIRGECRRSTIIEGKGECALVITANDTHLSHFNVRNCWNDAGIRITGSSVTVTSCDVRDNYNGVAILGNDVQYINNTVHNNSYTGILVKNVYRPIIRGCTVLGNNDGMHLSNAAAAIITKNNFTENAVHGMRIKQNSLNNTIFRNTVSHNIYGLWISSSENNIIFFNNFIKNRLDAHDGSKNNWDNGTVGNYWDDYEGSDPNHDGIGSTPYPIPGGDNFDKYPLIKKAGWPTAHFTYSPALPFSTENVTFTDHSVDLDGNIVSWVWDFDDDTTAAKNEKWALICVSSNNNANETEPAHDGLPAQGLMEYYILKKHGYDDDHIIFMLWHDNASEAAPGTDGVDDYISIYGGHNDLLGPPPEIGGPDEPPEIDLDSSTNVLPPCVDNWKGALRYYINDELANKVAPTDDVLISLINHGSPTGAFGFEYPDSTSLSEDAFDSWIDQIECRRMTILVESSYSGRFIDAPVDGGSDSGIDDESNRILISSAGTEKAEYYPNTTKYPWAGGLFSHPFFEALDDGKSIGEAYSDALLYIYNPDQHPQMVDNTGTNATYSFLSNLAGDLDTISHRYTDNGTYNVTLTVADDDGNTGTATKTITVSNTPPTAAMTWEPLDPTDMDTIVFNGSDSIEPDGTIDTYTWRFGDGANVTTNDTVVTHRYADNGTYLVKLSVWDDDGSSNRTSKTIQVSNVPPTASVSTSPEMPTTADVVTCSGGNSTDHPDGVIANYTWTFGDNTTAYGRNVTHRYQDNGTYTVTLTVRDNDNDTATASRTVTVTNVAPQVGFTYTPSKPSDIEAVEFTDASTDPDGTIATWHWEFGDGASSSEQNPNHQFTEDRTYQLNLTIIDDDGATNTTSRTIEVHNVPPQPRLDYAPAEPKALDPVWFSAGESIDSDGSIVKWQWDFGDGNTSTGKTPIHTYPRKGYYTVNLTLTDDDGAVASLTQEVEVKTNPPTANFSYRPAQPTDIKDVTFNASSSTDIDGSIANYTWTFGDNTTGYGANVTHRYQDNGNYTVTLTVRDNDGASDSLSRYANVSNVPPTASFTYEPSAPKADKYVTFHDGSTDPDGDVVNATWDFGDGTSQGDGDLLNHKYTSPGTYTVRLTVRDNDGATANATRTIKVTDEDQAAGFEFIVLVAAIGILLFMWKRRMGVWRRR